MRCLLLGQGPLCDRISDWLGEEVICRVSRPLVPQDRAFLKATQADITVAVKYRHKLDMEVIEIMGGVMNLHNSYLPFGRGAHTNVWAIASDARIAGVTAHWMDAGYDTGPIVYREPFLGDLREHTGRSLWLALDEQAFDVFRFVWKDKKWKDKPTGQDTLPNAGTVHYSRDLESLQRINLSDTVVWADAIDRLRACTFPPHQGITWTSDGEEFTARIEIERCPPPTS